MEAKKMLRIANFDIEPLLEKLVQDDIEKQRLRDWFAAEHPATDEIQDVRDLFLQGVENVFMSYAFRRTENHHFVRIINMRVRQWMREHESDFLKIGYQIVTLASRFITLIDDLVGSELVGADGKVETEEVEVENDDLNEEDGTQQQQEDITRSDEGEFLYNDGISIRQLQFLVKIGGRDIVAWLDKQSDDRTLLTPKDYEKQWTDLVADVMIRNLHEDFKLMKATDEAKKLLREDFRTTLRGLNQGTGFSMLSLSEAETVFKNYTRIFQNQMVQVTAKARVRVDPKHPTFEKFQPKRRYLTDAEIADITNLPYNFSFREVTDVAQLNISKNLVRQLREVMIEPQLISSLKEQIHLKFRRSKVPEDHHVGLIASQAVGEQATQNGMNSFKHAGQTGDTGFDRIQAITKMPKIPTNPFVTICLKGNPTLREARYYASRIESTKVGDICDFIIGFDDSVPGTPALFGGRPEEGSGIVVDRYPREPWMDVFLQIWGNPDRPMHRNTWLIRGTCNVDKMYQRRISMHDIARTIENKYRDVRVLFSSLSVGVLEIWYHESYYNTSTKNMAKASTDEIRYLWLRDELIENASGLAVTNVPGYSDVVVKRLAISNQISEVRKIGREFRVQFNMDKFYRFNIPVEQTMDMLAMKADVSVDEVRYHDDAYFTVVSDMDEVMFKKNLNEVEVSKLEDLILSEDVEGMGEGGMEAGIGGIQQPKVVVTLDREAINAELINIESIVEFFNKQGQLAQFKPVVVNIDKFNLVIEIVPNADFTPEYVFKLLREDPRVDDLVKGEGGGQGIKQEFSESGFTITGVPPTVDRRPIQEFVLGFKGAVQFDFVRVGDGGGVGRRGNGKGKEERNQPTVNLVFKLTPPSPSQLWKSMKNVQGSDGCAISAVFTSESREQLNLRHYIMAKGYSLYELANLPFVDLSGCISSHPPEMFKVFGCEVGCIYTYMELMANGGKVVAARHNKLIADTLWYMGVPTPMDKRGKEIMLAGPFARAAFQETFKTLAAASLEGAKDVMTSSVTRTLVGEFERPEKRVEDEDAEKYSAQLLKSTLEELSEAGKKFERKLPRRAVRVGGRAKEVKEGDPFAGMYDQDVA